MRWLSERSLFMRQSAQLTLGTTLAQLIPVLAVFGLSRVYTTEHFGVFHLFFQLATALAPIMGLRMEQPMLTVADEPEAEALYALGVKFSAIIAISLLFLTGAAWVFYMPIVTSSLGPVIWLVAPVSFLAAQIVALQYWANRHANYKLIVASKVLLAIVANVLPLFCLLWLPASAWWLVLAWLAGLLLAWSWLAKKQHKWPPPMWKEKQFLKQTFHRWRHFATTNTPSLVADQLAGAIPIITFSMVFGQAMAGSFGFAQRLMIVPMIFIGASVSQVFFKHASDNANALKPISPLVKRLGLILLSVAIVCFVGAFFLAPEIIPWLFGSQWMEAGKMMSWLSLAMIIKFPVSALSNTFVVANRIRLQALWQWLALLVNLAGMAFSFWTKNIWGYVVWLVVQDVLLYVLYALLLITVARQRDKSSQLFASSSTPAT